MRPTFVCGGERRTKRGVGREEEGEEEGEKRRERRRMKDFSTWIPFSCFNIRIVFGFLVYPFDVLIVFRFWSAVVLMFWLFRSLCLRLSHTHTHAHIHIRPPHTHTHTHTH